MRTPCERHANAKPEGANASAKSVLNRNLGGISTNLDEAEANTGYFNHSGTYESCELAVLLRKRFFSFISSARYLSK